uniref:Protein DAMAGED DNA-BINDING 2 n=1 Tax=Chenopodium quinoa TaxID=63459 RepID=A0A803KRJ5_CHEQI
MLPRTRRAASPKIVIERDENSEESSSDEEVEDEQNGVVDDSEEDEVDEPIVEIKSREKKPITISLKKVCKVCKKSGHQAGFQGATYIDCPMKPCFLCKLPGHTTMNCPHRVATEHGVIPAPRKSTRHSVDYIFERQLRPHVPAKGQLGVWDYDKVYEKRVYTNIHSCLLNTMRFSSVNDGTIFGASSDGTISCTDLETGISESLMDLNPNGWHGPSSWRMLYGLDINSEKGLVLVADNFGYLYMLDTRTKDKIREAVLIHKKGSKVVGLHCNPIQPDLLLSCGNDHFVLLQVDGTFVVFLTARLWDLRHLEAGSSLGNLAHRRVVNSAYFSPHTGSKILTTAQDNRIRVWDSIYGNMESPSREIVHSHDFNRHLTAFRAEWDPKDSSESLAVIGRYISENYNGVALHPIDFIDVSTGQLVAEVIDPNITTISPVNKLHPRDDVLASGSSRSLFIWRPKDKSEDVQQKDEKKTIVFCGKADSKLKRKFGGESDESDDESFKSKGKMSKTKSSATKKVKR